MVKGVFPEEESNKLAKYLSHYTYLYSTNVNYDRRKGDDRSLFLITSRVKDQSRRNIVCIR